MQNTQTYETTRQIVEQLMVAFSSRDAKKMTALMSEDVVFENTGPAPDGTRFVGQRDVQAFWEQFFSDNPQASIEAEDVIVTDQAAAIRHVYSWSGTSGSDSGGYVRGATILQVRDGKIAGMYAYVKG